MVRALVLFDSPVYFLVNNTAPSGRIRLLFTRVDHDGLWLIDILAFHSVIVCEVDDHARIWRRWRGGVRGGSFSGSRAVWVGLDLDLGVGAVAKELCLES